MIEIAKAYPSISEKVKPFNHVKLAELQNRSQKIAEAQERTKAIYLRMKDAKLPLLLSGTLSLYAEGFRLHPFR
jgi:hypothetical protein